MAKRVIVRSAFHAVTGQEPGVNEVGEPITVDIKTYFTQQNAQDVLQLPQELIDGHVARGNIAIADDDDAPPANAERVEAPRVGNATASAPEAAPRAGTERAGRARGIGVRPVEDTHTSRG
jgi:hypothetical protein